MEAVIQEMNIQEKKKVNTEVVVKRPLEDMQAAERLTMEEIETEKEIEKNPTPLRQNMVAEMPRLKKEKIMAEIDTAAKKQHQSIVVAILITIHLNIQVKGILIVIFGQSMEEKEIVTERAIMAEIKKNTAENPQDMEVAKTENITLCQNIQVEAKEIEKVIMEVLEIEIETEIQDLIGMIL